MTINPFFFFPLSDLLLTLMQLRFTSLSAFMFILRTRDQRYWHHESVPPSLIFHSCIHIPWPAIQVTMLIWYFFSFKWKVQGTSVMGTEASIKNEAKGYQTPVPNHVSVSILKKCIFVILSRFNTKLTEHERVFFSFLLL